MSKGRAHRRELAEKNDLYAGVLTPYRPYGFRANPGEMVIFRRQHDRVKQQYLTLVCAA
jgi:hypothetical protein